MRWVPALDCPGSMRAALGHRGRQPRRPHRRSVPQLRPQADWTPSSCWPPCLQLSSPTTGFGKQHHQQIFPDWLSRLCLTIFSVDHFIISKRWSIIPAYFSPLKRKGVTLSANKSSWFPAGVARHMLTRFIPLSCRLPARETPPQVQATLYLGRYCSASVFALPVVLLPSWGKFTGYQLLSSFWLKVTRTDEDGNTTRWDRGTLPIRNLYPKWGMLRFGRMRKVTNWIWILWFIVSY